MSPVSPTARPADAATLPIESRLIIGALLLRLVTALVAFIANVTLPAHADQGFTVLDQPHFFWDTFARYDSGWYYGIASTGYAFVEGGRSNLAFFPLYPLLMRAGGLLLGGYQPDFYFAGIVVSWVAFSVAMVLLYRLALLDMPREHAARAVLYAALFPAAYFFGVVYSESLFFMTLLGAALAIRHRRWGWAALSGAAMTATRVNGVMLVPALVWMAWQAAPAGPPRRRLMAGAAASTAGIALYSAYNYALSGNPFEWYDSIQRWGYHPGGNPASGFLAIGEALILRPYAFLATERMAPYDTLNVLSAFGALAAVPFIWHRLGGPYAAIVVLGLILPLSTGQYEGLGRYCAVLFPLPIYLGSLEGEMRHVVLIGVAAMLYTLGLILFVNVHPMF
jgi:Mannosyltransferase (PIG-V)